MKKYQQIYEVLKSRIQKDTYPVGSYLPSENELCKTYDITRTTARKALDELLRDGFIEKRHGKGSQVKERRKKLGLLTLKGFSEAVGENVKTIFLQKPKRELLPENSHFEFTTDQLAKPAIFFERLRFIGDKVAMVESNWLVGKALEGFLEIDFVNESFFKTLSQRYLIEITGSEHEIRAVSADEKSAELLRIDQGSPILNISIRFTTSNHDLDIFSVLHCNTENYPIGNSYIH